MKAGKSLRTDIIVLVIDDDEAVRSAITAALGRLNLHVVHASDHDEGLERFHSACPDLVIINIHMPETDSFGMLQILSELAPDLPVIVLAERGNSDDLMRALRLGVSDYLLLPLADEAMLEHSIYNSLRRARLVEENTRIRKNLEQINAELERQIEIFQQDQQAGRHVQINMLPVPPQEIFHYRFNHKVIPSLYLSGDTVDYKKVSRHEILFYIADVSGHGSSSAFITILLRFRIEQMRKENVRGRFSGAFTPARLLAMLNRDMLESGLDKHITLVMFMLDDRTDTLTYSVAGHHPLPILLQDGKAAPIPVARSSFPIGLFAEAEYFDETLVLKGDFALYLFSDGILEHLQHATMQQKEAHLLTVVEKCRGDFESFKRTLSLSKSISVPDDIAVLSVTRA
jgi:sigma-B regulation protein RsbU (phosphoserine phosphatase)